MKQLWSSAEEVSAPIPIPKFGIGFGSLYRYRISVAHYKEAIEEHNFDGVSAETEGMVTSVVAFSDEEKIYFAKWM